MVPDLSAKIVGKAVMVVIFGVFSRETAYFGDHGIQLRKVTYSYSNRSIEKTWRWVVRYFEYLSVLLLLLTAVQEEVLM
jgi:hypothetical protein